MIVLPQFRNAIRGLGLADERVDAIDGLFEALDEDGGGSLDKNELKAAMRKLQRAVNAEQDMANEIVAGAEALRAAAGCFDAAGLAGQAFQASYQRLEQQRTGSLSARIGHLLMKRNFKIGDVKAKWYCISATLSLSCKTPFHHTIARPSTTRSHPLAGLTKLMIVRT